MKLIDTNILIYSEKVAFNYLRAIFDEPFAFRSVISTIEVLGFARLTAQERVYFETLFDIMPELSIVSEIATTAITLKQQKKMSLGDSLIAATALIHDLELYTNNINDFNWISGLKLFNPINPI